MVPEPDVSTSLSNRADFPGLADLTYLNTASIGLMPQPVRELALRFDEKISVRGTVGFDEAAETYALEGARAAGAILLGAESDLITVGKSATETFCQLAWALRPRTSCNLVVVDLDHPSTVYPWLRVAQESGATVRMLQVWDNPSLLSIEKLAELVDDHTWAIAVSHVQYATGHCLDLSQVASLAHAHGALAVIDATQSAGMVPIDVSASGVDALVAGGYKWLCGAFGASVGYVRRELAGSLDPPFAGWRTTPNPYVFDSRSLPLAPGAKRLEYSTMSYSAAVALAASIRYTLELGIERVRRHDQALSLRLVKGLRDLHCQILSPENPEQMTGIVTARYPARDGEAVAAQLNRAGVVVSPRFNATRFSLHHYNTAADVDRALECVQQTLSHS